jgi:hypothetical protein
MAQEVRVTTKAEIFDDHFESHEFLSPGGPLFEQVASLCRTDDGGKDSSLGKVWIVRDTSSDICRFLVWKDHEAVDCEGLIRTRKVICAR